MKSISLLILIFSLNLYSMELTNTIKLKNENAFLTKDASIQKGMFDATLKLELDLEDNSKIVNLNRLRLDAKDDIEPGKFVNDTYSKLSKPLAIGTIGRLELRELYYENVLNDTTLKLGKMQTVWGKADGIKLIDKLNPQDFTEFILEDFEDSRIPLWSISLTQMFNDFEFEFVWILDNTYHKLAEQTGSYAFTSPRIIPKRIQGVNVRLNDLDKPANTLKDSEVAIRYTKNFQNLEIGFYYIYTYEDFPVFYQDYDSLQNRVTITPSYEKSSMYGLSMDYSNQDFIFRVESGFTTGKYFLNSSALRGVKQSDELAYIFGVDWYGLEESLVSFQLSQSYLLQYDESYTRPELDTTMTFLYKKDFMNNILHFEALFIHNLHDGDGVIRPKLKYEWDEETIIYTGVDQFYGTKTGIYGQFQDQNRILLGIEKTF